MPPSTNELHAKLKDIFGYQRFKPGQLEALQHVLSGRDTLIVMPTGSGKSLIYQLAAMMLDGVALVVSPLIALMKDQADHMAEHNIPATFINSSLDAEEQQSRMIGLLASRYKVVLVSPERLRSRSFREIMSDIPLSLLVVDEAHCLSQWGHDFRPDYLYIAEARWQLKVPATLALTATATPRVQDDMLRMLCMPNAQRLVMGFNRPNLSLDVQTISTPDARLRYVKDFLQQANEANGAGIIYCGTRRDAEEVADFSRSVVGVNAQHYHAGLDSFTRAKVQDDFLSGDLPIVAATNAFGMGIDRPDVRWVLHYNMPGTLEAYYQEAGRAGRDELPARAVLMYSPRDAMLHEHFIESSLFDVKALRAVHEFMSELNGAATQTQAIEIATGLKDVQVRVALEQLAADGALRLDVLSAAGQVRAEAVLLTGDALSHIIAQARARYEHKRALLRQMIAYCETEDCRRRFILDYFGDKSDAHADVCCDNCIERGARTAGVQKPIEQMTQSERAALIVLDTVASLAHGVGAGKLAQVLKGSDSQEVARLKSSRNFGKFAALRMKEIEALIRQLADARYLKRTADERPVFELTSRGSQALKNREAIDVQLRPVNKRQIAYQERVRAAGGTLAMTEQLIRSGKSPEQTAAERGLAVGTIYSHLAQLIADKRIGVNKVIAPDVQRKVRAAIEKAGSVQYLSTIKQALGNENIDYSVIRCVVEAWKLEHSTEAKHDSSRI